MLRIFYSLLFSVICVGNLFMVVSTDTTSIPWYKCSIFYSAILLILLKNGLFPKILFVV